MTPDLSERIAAQLARLEEGMSGMRREFTDRLDRQDRAAEIERNDSHLSRKELHQKVNGVVEEVATMRGDIKIVGLETAQTRDTVKDLNAKFEAAAPTIAQVEQAKRVGVWLLGGGGFAALTAVGAALAWGEQLKAWLAHWLGIPH